MINETEIFTNAQRIFNLEAEGILNLKHSTKNSFINAIKLINSCQGNVIFLAVGKSGIIGEKIAATFSSLGIPASFIHATEAVHGDMGKIRKNDLCFYISHSGESPEIVNVLSHLRNFGNKSISITGNKESYIAKSVDVNIDTGVVHEADIRGVAPTTSAIATLAIGDALALTVADLHGFTKSDFYKFHPGGNLGKQLSS